MLDEFEPERPPQSDSQRTHSRTPVDRQTLPDDDWPDPPTPKSGRIAKAGYALFVVALTIPLLWVLGRSAEQTTAVPDNSSSVPSKEGGSPLAEADPTITVPAPNEPVEPAPDPDATALRSDDEGTPSPLSAREAAPTTPPPSASRVAGLLPLPRTSPSTRDAAPVDSAAAPRSSPRSAAPEPISPRPSVVEPPSSNAGVTSAPVAPPPTPAVADPPAALPRVAIDEPTLLPPVTPPAEPAAPEAAPRAAGPPTPTAAVSAAAAVEGERNAIRDALGRYRSAYNALDASAAQQVWPTVNQQSLSKAFEQLAQQTVAFDSCTIDIRGVLADAMCNGSTRFVPRVGGRSEHVMARRWNFRLGKASDGGWVIRGVDVR